MNLHDTTRKAQHIVDTTFAGKEPTLADYERALRRLLALRQQATPGRVDHDALNVAIRAVQAEYRERARRELAEVQS